MHQIDLSLTKEITKVEGAATLDVVVKAGKVEKCRFAVTEYKRFYTQAMRGKPYKTVPQLLARICGTCSNAHLMCSIEACEHALGITPSRQTQILKKLTMYGLNIRDHALHLYLFSLPDMYGKDSFLSFDENDPEQHEILHDAFAIKGAGNFLSIIIAGRSVHALHPTIGGWLHFPKDEEIKEAIAKLKEVRFAVLRTIERFAKCDWHFDRKTHFMALTANPFSFLEGTIISDTGLKISEADFKDHLEHVVIPYSEASGYTFDGQSYMVGALARINLAKDSLHDNTKKDAAAALTRFPSTNIFDNNLAQAIELLHCVDHSIELLETEKFMAEEIVKPTRVSGIGVGVIEAPRGTLYHKVEINEQGNIVEGEIVVPTGQNQINIEQDMARLVEELLPQNPPQETIQLELEKLIRAYDPCMSCASHFLKLNIAKVSA
ncbi:TPA: hypothetical protein DCQ82_01095 [Candidatus Veblenbacteria bacterium]|nr:hypothetical protein [Candidatus Veblenbacteria bacterium]